MAKDEKTNKVNNKEVYWGMPEDKLAEIMKGSTEDIYEALNILSEQLKTEYEGNEMEAEIVKFEQELETIQKQEAEEKKRKEIESKFAFLKKELERVKNQKLATKEDDIPDEFPFC